MELEIIEAVRQRLSQFEYECSEADIDMLRGILARCDELIRNTINRADIPEGIFYARVDWICGEFLCDKRYCGMLSEEELKLGAVISAIQEGDISVSYSKDKLDRIDTFLSRLKDRLGKELNSYKCLRWD